MKKLLTILLITFSLQGMGQEIDTSNFTTMSFTIDSTNFSLVRDYTSIVIDTIDWSYFMIPFKYRHNPIDLMLMYADECYTDSTQVEVNINPDRNFSKDGSSTLIYYEPIYELQWKHREPTFAGFIEWIKSKDK